MVEVDYDKLLEYSEVLVDYDGMLPLLIRAVIMEEWTRNLNNKGLYLKVISECCKNRPHNYTEAVNELKEWCKHNKEYKDILI
jgi:hypothetical protein